MSTRDLLILAGLLPFGVLVLAAASAGVIQEDAALLGWLCFLVGGGVLVVLVAKAVGGGEGR